MPMHSLSVLASLNRQRQGCVYKGDYVNASGAFKVVNCKDGQVNYFHKAGHRRLKMLLVFGHIRCRPLDARMQMIHSERCIAILHSMFLVSGQSGEIRGGGMHSAQCAPARMSGRNLKMPKLAFELCKMLFTQL